MLNIEPTKVTSWGTAALLGEGPSWHQASDRLYWVDIKGQQLHWLDLPTGTHHFQTVDEPLCWVLPTDGDWLLAGFHRSVELLHPSTFTRKRLFSLQHEPSGNRLNDAKLDRQGQLWFGSMHDQERQSSGNLYRMSEPGIAECVDSGYVVSNGPAISREGDRLYHACSSSRVIFRFCLDDKGNLSDKQLFIRFSGNMGFPDGMTIDSEGGLWVAQWGGGGICRFDVQGKLERRIAMPVPYITSLAFGGENLNRLFVTSASLPLSAAQRKAMPTAGCLFEVDCGFSGVAEASFALPDMYQPD
jgi:xylono-1,5-lactonase